MTHVRECRTREHFPGCRASAPRVPELKPRPYPVDFPTTLRVLSERDTCPRVPPADKTLRKPPELATRSECLNSKLPREPSESPRVPRLTSGESRIPPASPECAARSACDGFPRMPPVAPRVPSRRPPGCRRAARESPRKTLPDARRVRRVSTIPGAKFQKMIVTSKIHRNSSLHRKNLKPIIIVIFL